MGPLSHLVQTTDAGSVPDHTTITERLNSFPVGLFLARSANVGAILSAVAGP